MSCASFLASLLLTYAAVYAGGIGASSKPHEPTRGLMDIALQAGELDTGVWRRVRLLLDPEAEPPTYVFQIPGTPRGETPPPDPVQPFRAQMSRLGVEAAVYLSYTCSRSPLYVKILRFPKTTEAERQWSMRWKLGQLQAVTVRGAEILFTKPGQLLREDLKAGMDTLESRAGRYWIRVAPARPEPSNPGFEYLLKQLEKIRSREPAGAANGSQPIRSGTNRTSSAAGSRR